MHTHWPFPIGLIVSVALCCCVFSGWPLLAAERDLGFEVDQGVVAVKLGDRVVARYVTHDPLVPRPYWCALKTPAGLAVTREHPPRPELDATDHVGIHTGLWLSFGDLNGQDYWRLKARTEFVRFEQMPRAAGETGEFTTVQHYWKADNTAVIAEETCRVVVQTTPTGYLLALDSTFHPVNTDLVFGDQEEMGLGIRLATPLAVDRKLGGRILDSTGRKNGGEVWGKTSPWCDYSGIDKGRWIGATLFSSPQNFRPSWNHARDYGFLAVNPFGRQAFTGQDPSRIIVKQGETLRLKFGVAIHDTVTEAEAQPAHDYERFVKLTATQTP